MKIIINISPEINFELYKKVTELREKGIKTSKAKLIEEIIKNHGA
jgi:hypothetical protein